MCGICGEINLHSGTRVETIRGMCKVLSHRGPDDEGMLFTKGDQYSEVNRSTPFSLHENAFEVGLGHRRLSIIDLSEAAHQPMCNEEGTIWIVYNGEIYNFQDLRRELEGKKHLFKSRSDTEVVLHAYEEWGVECLNRFRGMFAFGIWDSKLKRLFLARDRFGKKPLVYSSQNGRFAFASEIKALLQVPWIERKVSGHAIHHYLTYQYIPSPDSIFEGIKKLPPAHYLLLDRDGNLKIERYWRLNFNSSHHAGTDPRELMDRIRTELEESVQLRLVSDVPLGAFLSGGVDSSLVVGLMSKLSGKPVKTFSIGFEEKEFDELHYSRIVSDHFATEHHEFIVKPNAVEILPELVWHYNEPFADSSAIPTYYVARLTKDFVKVVLTGDAGDENFAGYRRYLWSKWAAVLTRIPEKVRGKFIPFCLRGISSWHWNEKALNRLADYMERLSGNQARDYSELIKIFNATEKGEIYTGDLATHLAGGDGFDFLLNKFEEAETDDLLERLLYVDINSYLPEDLLVKMDIATMANSLEARVPLLDHKFVEVAARIPANLKLKGSIGKFILKQASLDLLPEPILKRKKMGFAVPVSKWLRNELKSYAYEILLDRKSLGRGYFKEEGIRRLLDEHMAQRYDHSAKIWALLFLEIWFRVFMDGEGNFCQDALRREKDPSVERLLVSNGS